MKPQLGERIQDPASGSCGFLISGDHFIRSENSKSKYAANPPLYQVWRLKKARSYQPDEHLSASNERQYLLGDACPGLPGIATADWILANPPLGQKPAVQKNAKRHPFTSTYKQFLFVTAYLSGLKIRGRAARSPSDNVLFESAWVKIFVKT